MLQRKPSCFNEFRCIASACKDNCCIGWEIDIDEESLDFYQKQKGDIGHRLEKYISIEETPHFLLAEDERCPFLNKNNLCDLIIELGEEAICDICTEHPRFYNTYGSYREMGWGLCCEEAVRILLADSSPLAFEEEELLSDYEDEWPEEELWDIIFPLRNLMIQIIQKRQFSFTERIAVLLSLSEQVQIILDENCTVDWTKFMAFYSDTKNWEKVTPASIKDSFRFISSGYTIERILLFFQTLEILNPEWLELLKALEASHDEIVNKGALFLKEYKARGYVYEHLLVYFIYRHILNAVWDADLLTKVEFCVLSCLFIQGIDIFSWIQGDFSFEKQEEHIKNYSKEIEYSTENISNIEDFLRGFNYE